MYMYGEDDLIPTATTFWSIGMGMNVATGINMEEGFLEFDDDNFPHVVGEVGSRGFEHGAATAYYFDGPLFEDVKNCYENGEK